MAHRYDNMSPRKTGEKKSKRSLHVVVAEDDYFMRKLIASVLAKEHFTVTECADGVELSDMMTQGRIHTIDIIISDLRMPGITGLEFLEMIRGNNLTIPVIIITAFGDDETHEIASKLGAWAVFDKPFDLDDLVAAVRETVGLQSSGNE